MRGTVKFFDVSKGWGFLTGEDNKDYFVHHSQIQMNGFRKLNTDDIVDFEIGTDKDGREKAVNVQPVITRRMVEESLYIEGLDVKTIKNANKNNLYVVVKDNVVQTSEQGMSLIELAAFAGIDVEGLE